MAVPGFQAFFLPVLQAVASGRYSRKELPAVVADLMQLTAEEREEMIASGRRPRYYDRTGWAKSYLTQAGLVQAVARGVYELTDRGKEVLASNPAALDVKFLSRYPEFVEFQKRSREPGPGPGPGPGPEPPVPGEGTPEERIDSAARELRSSLIEELLIHAKAVTPRAFEQLVLDLLRAMGYGGDHEGAHELLGKAGDGGVDGVIREDKLGLDEVYIQAKRYNSNDVGPEIVRALSGSLDEKGTHKGVLITTSEFTKAAQEVAKNIKAKRISLIGGRRLAELMLEHGLGVVETSRYIVHRIDSDFFEELEG